MGLWIPKSVPNTAMSVVAQIAESGFAARAELLLGHDYPNGPTVFHQVEAVDAGGVVANTPRRFLCHLDLGDQVALGCIPPREPDAGGLSDDAASSVAPDEILSPQ